MKHLQTEHAEDSKAMLEIIQSKGEELLRREEEGKTMRLLYESEVFFFFSFCVFGLMSRASFM